MGVGRKSIYTDAQLIEAVKSSFYLADIQRKLGLKKNTNYSELNQRILLLGLDTSHFLPRWERGLSLAQKIEKELVPLESMLIENSTYNQHSLRKRLIDEGVLEYKCNRCGLVEWDGIILALELHHKNGVKRDNRIENLEFLCPNCHSITPTWKGKNRK